MKTGSVLKGTQRKNEKREKTRAKIEGRDARPNFPPLVLIILLVAGTFLTLFQPLNILLIIFPLMTRKTVAWDFRLCIKLGAMIGVVIAITNFVFFYQELGIASVLMSFAYTLAISSLIMYTGVFLVAMFEGRR